MNNIIRLILTCITCVLLIACGGSSKNKSSTVSPDVKQAMTVKTLSPILKELTYDPVSLSKTGKITITLAEGDISLLLQLTSKNNNKVILITEIKDPLDNIIYSASLKKSGNIDKVTSDYTSAILGDTGSVSTFLPTTPKMKLMAGDYIFSILSEDKTDLSSAIVYIKSNPINSDIDLTDLKFDLNVWVAHPSAEFNSAEFKATFSNQYKESFNALFSDNRLSVGDIKFFTATPDQVSKFTSLDVEKEYGEACRAMMATTGASLSLNLAFVTELTSSEIPGIAGVSTSGSILNKDSNSSCFFVAQSAYVADIANSFSEAQAINMQAANIIHEAGHFMGLPHTTEGDGKEFDFIDDTEQCEIAIYDGRMNTDFNVAGVIDGEVSDHECGVNGGASNFLFYAGTPDFLPFVMSTDQAWVLRRHPLSTLQK